jgi:recombination protein RecR
LAFHLLRTKRERVESLAAAMLEARNKIFPCSVCQNLTDVDPCHLCADSSRDRGSILVVEEPKDVLALEKTREYHGLYHVLGGVISPMDGIGPGALRIGELLERLKSGGVEEVILATNPDVEGEATALYLARLIGPLGIRTTRIARGIPVGGDLDYADEVTLARALEGRREVG